MEKEGKKKIRIKREIKYFNLVNFKGNLDKPIHRWFNIKEGYSRELIFSLINEFKIKEGYIVDFFSGSGTTLLAAKEKGLKYYGFEINPFLFLLSLVKLYDYTNLEIKKIITTKNKILKSYNNLSSFERVGLSILKKVFRKNLNDILKVREIIFNIKNKKIRNFFIIAFTSILEDVGCAKKDGNGLKYPRNKRALDFIDKFSEKVDLMIKDINKMKTFYKIYKNRSGSKVLLMDSRDIPKNYINKIKKKTSLVVFSPPYANCFDYSEVYKLELWLSGFVTKYGDLVDIRKKSLSSHLNKDLSSYNEYYLLKNDLKKLKNKKTWSAKILNMLSGYFYDMEKILKVSYDILSKGGYCIIIVGNSAYSGYIIKTDVILSKIALRLGFSDVEINIARKLRASSQQAKLLRGDNSLRESVVIIRK